MHYLPWMGMKQWTCRKCVIAVKTTFNSLMCVPFKIWKNMAEVQSNQKRASIHNWPRKRWRREWVGGWTGNYIYFCRFYFPRPPKSTGFEPWVPGDTQSVCFRVKGIRVSTMSAPNIRGWIRHSAVATAPLQRLGAPGTNSSSEVFKSAHLTDKYTHKYTHVRCLRVTIKSVAAVVLNQLRENISAYKKTRCKLDPISKSNTSSIQNIKELHGQLQRVHPLQYN